MKYKYFSPNELKCKCAHCNSTGDEMDNNFMEMLETLREKVGPLVLSSAYRCPVYNNKVSSTGMNGPHTTGRAVDIACIGGYALKVIKFALEIGFSGIGVNQKGTGRFIHVDTLTLPEYPRPNIWSY